MPRITDPEKRQLSDAIREANRLNRIYADDYKRYRNALFPTPHMQKKALQKQQKIAQKITKKDKKNAIIDELTALARHTYIDGVTEKVLIKKHIATKAKKIISTLPKKSVPVLTSYYVQTRLAYDPEEGTFIWNDGRNEGKPCGMVRCTTKVPRAQNMQRLPLKSKKYRPSLSGYYLVTESAYNEYCQLKETTRYKNNNDLTPIYARHYLIRTPKTDLYATKRMTYYLKPYMPTPVIRIQNANYPANQIAYLYMEAGGDWDYSQGLDKMHRINTTVAPEGLHCYDPRTNKRVHIPCRDGDKLNLKWDNIKPEDISASQLVKDPTKPAVKLKRTRVYSPRKYIERVVPYNTPLNPRWVVNFKNSIPLFYGWTEQEALDYFYASIEKMQGKKIHKANGDVWVVRQ